MRYRRKLTGKSGSTRYYTTTRSDGTTSRSVSTPNGSSGRVSYNQSKKGTRVTKTRKDTNGFIYRSSTNNYTPKPKKPKQAKVKSVSSSSGRINKVRVPKPKVYKATKTRTSRRATKFELKMMFWLFVLMAIVVLISK
jgi:hypothetical protein